VRPLEVRIGLVAVGYMGIEFMRPSTINPASKAISLFERRCHSVVLIREDWKPLNSH
jgi:hypothetical protein